VTRQLAYSRDETRRALDLGLFINGLPVATFEVKNRFTGQRVDDAVLQYQRDRLPSEALFVPGRCVVHFAVDDREVRFCAELRGKDSWFLPFNQGFNDGAGNPPNAAGLATAYLWEKILTPASLTDIVEHYAQMIEEKNERTGKKSTRPIFPRYHQLDGVRRLLADVDAHGVGRRYLIQHSAGSGKSNSIAWLTHQLVERVDQVIVVTDRRLLDRQLNAIIKNFVQVGATLGSCRAGGGSAAVHGGGQEDHRQYGAEVSLPAGRADPPARAHVRGGHR
jgi:type I restriction enzyme R subunit